MNGIVHQLYPQTAELCQSCFREWESARIVQKVAHEDRSVESARTATHLIAS
jgi:hypothetical protein